MRILAVTNMYPTAQDPTRGTFVEQQIKGLREIGLDVDVVFVDRVQKGMLVYTGLLRQLQERLNHFDPDVIHVMCGGVMASMVTKSVTNKPVVVTYHGTDLLGEHSSGYLRNLIANFGVVASRKAARGASGIIVVAKALRKALPNNLNGKPIQIIPCGIDLGRFKPLDQDVCRDRLHWNPDRFHVLFTSNRAAPVKRPELAAAAVRVVNQLGIPAEIHYLRGVPNDEVPIWINASNLLLLTSLHEGSPTIVKETLACNVPVVSVDVGDVREQIQGLQGCYLALPEPDDLADKIRMVYCGPRRVIARNRMEQLSLERIASRLREFYEEVADSFR